MAWFQQNGSLVPVRIPAPEWPNVCRLEEPSQFVPVMMVHLPSQKHLHAEVLMKTKPLPRQKSRISSDLT
jgi:hypothetical protein